MKNKLIINFTPTGMIPTKEITPHVPVNPKEIARETLMAAKMGVSIVHLHARDEAGKPTYKKEIYQEIIKNIREKDKDIIICVSTSGRNFNGFDQRSECLEIEGELKPDMASLTLSSLNFNNQESVNSPDMIKKLAQKMIEKNIKPELEVFDMGMINYAKYLIKKDLLKPPYYFNLLFGNIACAQATLLSIGFMINELPDNSVYSLAGIGSYQEKINNLGVICDLGVRVGLEDNIWLDEERTKLATNMELLDRVINLSKIIKREIANPKEVRELLCLSTK